MPVSSIALWGRWTSEGSLRTYLEPTSAVSEPPGTVQLWAPTRDSAPSFRPQAVPLRSLWPRSLFSPCTSGPSVPVGEHPAGASFPNTESPGASELGPSPGSLALCRLQLALPGRLNDSDVASMLDALSAPHPVDEDDYSDYQRLKYRPPSSAALAAGLGSAGHAVLPSKLWTTHNLPLSLPTSTRPPPPPSYLNSAFL